MRADHLLAAQPEVDLTAVAEHPVVMHPRAANPDHYDRVMDLFRQAGVTPRLFEPALAFDPSQRAIREGRAIGLVGASSTGGLAEELRWVPLADPGAFVVVALVLRDGQLSAVTDRFERVSIATAAAAGWLDAPPSRSGGATRGSATADSGSGR